MDDLVKDLREESLSASQVAWSRTDGGLDYTIAAQLADAAADRIEEQADRIAALEAENARAEAALAEAVEAHIHTAASLAAAISLLERGGKKAAPSDKMFAQMLDDYRKALEVSRATLAKIKEAKNGSGV